MLSLLTLNSLAPTQDTDWDPNLLCKIHVSEAMVVTSLTAIRCPPSVWQKDWRKKEIKSLQWFSGHHCCDPEICFWNILQSQKTKLCVCFLYLSIIKRFWIWGNHHTAIAIQTDPSRTTWSILIGNTLVSIPGEGVIFKKTNKKHRLVRISVLLSESVHLLLCFHLTGSRFFAEHPNHQKNNSHHNRTHGCRLTDPHCL